MFSIESSFKVQEYTNPADNPEVVAFLHKALDQRLGGLVSSEGIDQYASCLLPGDEAFSTADSAPTDTECYGVIEEKLDGSEQLRGLATFGKATDRIINDPEFSSFNAATAQAQGKNTAPAPAWIETFAYDQSLLPKSVLETATAALASAVVNNLRDRGHVVAGYRATYNHANEVADYIARQRIEALLLPNWYQASTHLASHALHKAAQQKLQRRVFAFDLTSVANSLS